MKEVEDEEGERCEERVLAVKEESERVLVEDEERVMVEEEGPGCQCGVGQVSVWV